MKTNKARLIDDIADALKELDGRQLVKVAKKLLKNHESIKADSIKYGGEEFGPHDEIFYYKELI